MNSSPIDHRAFFHLFRRQAEVLGQSECRHGNLFQSLRLVRENVLMPLQRTI